MLFHIQCVAFDAVGTLVYPEPPVAEVYARVGRKFGSELSEEEIRTRFRDVFRLATTEEWSAGTTDENNERRRWSFIVRSVFHDVENFEACFEELFAHFGKADSWRCFPDVAETLSELAARGYDTAIASNFDRRLHAVCDGHPELKNISTRVISSEVGSSKPSPAFYDALLDLSRFEKRDILMVGDDWINDIRGAGEAGIRAAYLDRLQSNIINKDETIPTIFTLTELLDLLP